MEIVPAGSGVKRIGLRITGSIANRYSTVRRQVKVFVGEDRVFTWPVPIALNWTSSDRSL